MRRPPRPGPLPTTRLAAVLLTLTAVVATGPAAGATPSTTRQAGFAGTDSPEVLPLPACATGWADLQVAPAGRRRQLTGFAHCGGDDTPVHLLERRGHGWTATRTPYRGRILAQATDATGAYVLLLRPGPGRGPSGTLLLGRRDGTTFRPPVRIGRVSTVWDTTLAAYDGKWWAVWTESPADPDGMATLHEARTFGRPTAARPLPGPPPDPYGNAGDPGGVHLLLDRRGATLSFSIQRVRVPVHELWIGRGAGGRWRLDHVGGLPRESTAPLAFAMTGGTAWFTWAYEGTEPGLTAATRSASWALSLPRARNSARLANIPGAVAIAYTSRDGHVVVYRASPTQRELSDPVDLGPGVLADLTATRDELVVLRHPRFDSPLLESVAVPLP